MSETRIITVTVNGKAYTKDVPVRLTLADFLRSELGLTGTHLGCEHGVCGACTILLDGRSARSCLLLAVQTDGHELLTVEGLEKDGKLHPIQKAFGDCYGLQCGYCTPGFMMSAYQLLSENSQPNEKDIRKAIAGNTCRCTGYQNIFKAIQAAAESAKGI